jgi:hypothetical protein
MSYAPSTFHAGTGEDFFRKEGFLDGMEPLLVCDPTITTPDFTSLPAGNAITITDSEAKCTGSSGTYAFRFAAWTFATSTKLLAVGYFHRDTFLGLATGTGVVGTADQGYYGYTPGGTGFQMKKASGGYSTIGEDLTIQNLQAVTAHVYGMALYVDAASNTQVLFAKFGTSSKWFPVVTTGDDTAALDDVTCMYIGSTGGPAGTVSRFISPIMVWGS